MAAQIQAFLLACPVSPTAGRAVRWDQLKARAAYLADPTSQPALDQLRHTAAHLQQHRQQQAVTEAGCCSMLEPLLIGVSFDQRGGRCLFLYGKKPSRTPDEPEMCRNNGLDCTRRSGEMSIPLWQEAFKDARRT
ncbi:hypothetical protein ABBQ38_000502 [Trebouxia sp. C0009 RCD-2024]